MNLDNFYRKLFYITVKTVEIIHTNSYNKRDNTIRHILKRIKTFVLGILKITKK